MAETSIGKAYVQIIPTAKGISNTIKQELSGGASKAGTSAGNTLVSKLKGILVAAGIGKAIESTVSAALESGGALQQSFGGLETIYGDAAEAAKEYAMQASSMGISANTFAEQAVSMGAALKSAYGGDTAKAMDAANLAIQDMADNSAKMGTDIGSLQTAYQGFAKQNYTMLDNLKLGYGGTKKEMERLLKDASKLTGVTYNIDNLGDVYSAIHAIQGELGLTGVAAQEAATTLTGSIGALKANWTNLLAAMTTGGDITTPLTGLMTSINNFLFGNLLPMLGNFVTALPSAIMPILQTAITSISGTASSLLSTESINAAMGALNGFLSQVPQFMTAGFQMIQNVGAGIAQSIPQIIAKAAEIISSFIAAIATHLPSILQTGITLIGQLSAGIINAIPDVIRAIPRVISSITDAFGRFDWDSIGSNIISGIANGLKNGVGLIVDAAKNAAQSAFEAAKNFLQIGSPSKLFEKEIGKQIDAGIAKGITKNTGMITSALDTASTFDVGTFSASRMNTAPATYGGGGFNQNITINSPRELSPFEVARQTRNATQQMALAISGVA